MFTKTIEITEVSFDELADKVADKLLLKIEDYIKKLDNNKNDIYLTRTETSKFLKIDPSTLWHWTNKGLVKSYGISNRRYYNKKELIELLKSNELKISKKK